MCMCMQFKSKHAASSCVKTTQTLLFLQRFNFDPNCSFIRQRFLHVSKAINVYGFSFWIAIHIAFAVAKKE